MESERFLRSVSFVLTTSVAAFILATAAWAASIPQVIYSLAGEKDGEYTDTDLVIDSAGNLYGTSVQGGAFGGGTVFRLSPSATGWKHKVLYSFTGGADGGEPYKGVTLDSQGNLYGTAVTGGGGFCEGGCGVAYKLTHVGTTWKQTVIHTFTGGNDGSGPGAGLTLDEHGNVYGMTPTGGANGLGVIFRLHPQASGEWKIKVLHTFNGDDGATGSAGRLLLRSGTFYGAATVGGANGQGTIFSLKHIPGQWQFKTLYSFKGQPDAGFPYGGLTFDQAGNLYGTTYYDGAYDFGAVYQLSPQPDGSWTEKVLYSFKGGRDGMGSISNLVLSKKGALYGTTSEGGSSCSCGTIFQLKVDALGNWIERVIYRFTGVPDAGFAYNGMVADAAGNLYGATVHGGTNNDGAIYKFTP